MRSAIMIDLETLGSTNQAAIIQIGACFFDPQTAEIGAEFKKNITFQSSIDAGLKLDGSTLSWWMKQSDAARASVTADAVGIADALHEFQTWVKDNETPGHPAKVWSHATFDFVILQSAFAKTATPFPFRYKLARDIRTLTDLADYDPFVDKRDGTHHDALEDCRYQVRYVCRGLEILREAHRYKKMFDTRPAVIEEKKS